MKRAIRSRRKVSGQLLEHAVTSRIGNAAELAGQDRIITQAFRAKNFAADPVRNYEIARKEIACLLGEFRKRRFEFLGFYHSHPHWLDTNEPSPMDIAPAYYSEAIYFIVTPRPYATTSIRGFSSRMGVRQSLKFRSLSDVNAQLVYDPKSPSYLYGFGVNQLPRDKYLFSCAVSA